MTTASPQDKRKEIAFFDGHAAADSYDVFTPQSNLGTKVSDYVAAAQVDLGRNFGAIVSTRIDNTSFRISRLDAEVRAALWRLDAYGRYFSVDDTLNPDNPGRELQAALGVRLVRGWRLQFGVRRDLDSNTNLSQDLSAIYEDECTFLEFAYSRSEAVDRRLGPDESFRIRVGLRSLGAGGRSSGY